jgi:hypothetical protein
MQSVETRMKFMARKPGMPRFPGTRSIGNVARSTSTDKGPRVERARHPEPGPLEILQSRLKKLIEGRANLRVVYDGFRNSYASYRIRQLKGDLNKLAEEMGSSRLHCF